MDFSIFRGFPIGGAGKRLEFRTEFFNLTNTPMWGVPIRDIPATTSGAPPWSATTTLAWVTTAARETAGSGERQIRFGLRFQF